MILVCSPGWLNCCCVKEVESTSIRLKAELLDLIHWERKVDWIVTYDIYPILERFWWTERDSQIDFSLDRILSFLLLLGIRLDLKAGKTKNLLFFRKRIQARNALQLNHSKCVVHLTSLNYKKRRRKCKGNGIIKENIDPHLWRITQELEIWWWLVCSLM